MSKRHLELVAGTSAKFWQIEQDGSDLSLSWGRIGTNGQTKTKSFADEATATAEADKLVRQKLAKGYVEIGRKPGRKTKAKKPRTKKAKASSKTKATKSLPRTTQAKKASPSADVFARLEAALEKNAPEVLAKLNEGASEGQIAALKKAVGVELPESFYDWYRWRNGSSGELRWLDGDRWLGTKAVAQNKSMMDDIVDGGHYSNFADDEWWSQSWVAFSDDESGHSALVIDTRGSFAGKAGQVMWAAAKEYDRIVQSKSFDDWLELLVATFEQGKFVVEDDCYLFENHSLQKKLCRGYPKRFSPSEAAAPTEAGDLSTPTQEGWPDGVDPSARWLVQPSGERTKHCFVVSKKTAVTTWSGSDLAKLKESTKKAKSSDDARGEHDKQLRKKIKGGFCYLRHGEATRGACLALMQLNTPHASLSSDGRTIAYGKVTRDEKCAELYVADVDTGRRQLVHGQRADRQHFVHMVDFDDRDRIHWMVNHATSRVVDSKAKLLANIEDKRREELFNPFVSRSEIDAAGRRILTFHKDGFRVHEGGKIIFNHPVKRGKCEYRYAGLSPSGRLVAICYASRYVIYSHEDAKGDKTSEIQIFDVDSGKLEARVPMPAKSEMFLRVGVSPDDSQVVIADYRNVFALDIASGKKAWTRKNTRLWAYSPNGDLLAVADRGCQVDLLDARTRRKVASFGKDGPWASPHSDFHTTDRLTFCRDGSRLLQINGGQAYVWSL